MYLQSSVTDPPNEIFIKKQAQAEEKTQEGTESMTEAEMCEADLYQTMKYIGYKLISCSRIDEQSQRVPEQAS